MPLRNLQLAGMLAALVAFAASPSQVAAATVDVDVQRDGDTVLIHAGASLGVDAATAWQVLTDYERYADFIPGVHSSRVIARRGGVVEVEQYDDALWSPLHVASRITYEVTEMPPNRLSSLAAASALPQLESGYVLTPTTRGTRLEYTGRVAGGSMLLGRIGQWVIERKVTRQFQALADRIERGDEFARRAPR